MEPDCKVLAQAKKNSIPQSKEYNIRWHVKNINLKVTYFVLWLEEETKTEILVK